MDYTHSYPFDWRTKKPIIFRATPQWFASVDKIREQILDALKDVKFLPEWGQKRLHNMIRDRGDWVISRQRVWGVPLPIFYAEDGTPIMGKRLNTLRNYLKNMVLTSGLNGMLRTCYQKATLANIHQTERLPRKPILWTFGSTPVLHIKGFGKTRLLEVSS